VSHSGLQHNHQEKFYMRQSQRSNLILKFAMTAFISAVGIGVPFSVHADVDAGADSFDANCAECHSLKAGKNKKGPSLAAITGRKAASVSGFTYSDGLAASGLTWTNDKLDAYITNPKTQVPAGKMKFKGLPDAKERADLIEFLAEQK